MTRVDEVSIRFPEQIKSFPGERTRTQPSPRSPGAFTSPSIAVKSHRLT
jgi:hypothetical protein